MTFDFFQGSLIANMIMGMVILRKRYDLSKYVSVLLITLGIVVCTVVSGSEIVSSIGRDEDYLLSVNTYETNANRRRWSVGVV